MLYLEENTKAIDEHYKEVKQFINQNLPQYTTNISQFVQDNIDELIIGKPQRLIELNNLFYNNYSIHCSSQEHDLYCRKKIKANTHLNKIQAKQIRDKYKLYQEEIAKIINYETWSSLGINKGAYRLAQNLDKSTCIYCNRIYTLTITKDRNKLMRPQFDHWFSKSNYPLLALSFYNLIPSCPFCNSSIKGNIVFDLDNFLHPYLDKEEFKRQKLSYNLTSDLKFKTKINLITSNLKAMNTFDALHLKDVYEAHQSEINDLINLKIEYSKDYISDIIKLFNDSDLDESEIYRMVFGIEIDANNYHKRPFSKLKRDILEELGII